MDTVNEFHVASQSAFFPALIRQSSIKEARQLGIEIPSSLPHLDPDLRLRSTSSILDRILAMHAAVASAAGFETDRAISWLRKERLIEALASDERACLFEGNGKEALYPARVEAIWALAWVIGLAPTIRFDRSCDDNLVDLLPNLENAEASKSFRASIHIRSLEYVISACDLAYCLHWAIRDTQLRGLKPPNTLEPCTIIERRRALEWAIGESAWEDVQLDT